LDKETIDGAVFPGRDRSQGPPAEADLAESLNLGQVCQKLGISLQTLHR
jgi:hypothetical protein